MIPHRTFQSTSLGLFVWTLVALPGWSQTPPENSVDDIHRWADAMAAKLEIHRSQDSVTVNDSDQTIPPFEMIDRSLLRWTNPIVGDVAGDCYLWTDRGRPAAFLSVYAFRLPVGNRRLTFQSLSPGGLSASLQGRVIWNPVDGGLRSLTDIELPAPATQPMVRRRQMQQLAGSFEAEIQDQSGAEAYRTLRLLPKPLHQYQSPAQQIAAGSLYAFVDGTDPEVLLMIECVEDGRSSRLQAAAIRQNHRRLRLTQRGQPVWDVPALAPPFPNPRISDPAGVYYNVKWQEIAATSISGPDLASP